MRGQCAWPQKGEHVRDVVRLAEIDTGVAHGCSGRRHLHSRTTKSQLLASAMISNDRRRFCGSKMSATIISSFAFVRSIMCFRSEEHTSELKSLMLNSYYTY